MDTKFIQDSTEAYIIAYSTAMEKTHNPTLAMQIATSVVLAYMSTFKDEINQRQQAANFLGTMFSAMAQSGSDDEVKDPDKN